MTAGKKESGDIPLLTSQSDIRPVGAPPNVVSSTRRRPNSYSLTPALRKQLKCELKNHIWGSSPDAVARMLSPKLSGSDGKVRYLIEHERVEERLRDISDDEIGMPTMHWPLSESQRPVHKPICEYLASCIELCSKIYEDLRKDERCADLTKSGFTLQERGDCYAKNLAALLYDKWMGDLSIGGSPPLKPDLGCAELGSSTTPDTFKLFFSLGKETRDETSLESIVVVEVKKYWYELVLQLATYARAQFAVSPFRRFVVTIAVNHHDGKFSFVIFHRGGVTMSAPMKIAHVTPVDSGGGNSTASTAYTPDPSPIPAGALRLKTTSPNDQRDGDIMRARRCLVKLMLCVVLWQDLADAGHSPLTNGRLFCIPLPHEVTKYHTSMLNSTIYYGLSLQGRNTLIVPVSLFLPADEPSSLPPYGFQTLNHKSVARLTGGDIPILASSSRGKSAGGILKTFSNKRKAEDDVFTISSKGSKRSRTEREEEDGDDDETERQRVPDAKFITNPRAPVCFPGHTEDKDESKPNIFNGAQTVIMKTSWPTSDKRATESNMYERARGSFGTVKLIHSFEGMSTGNLHATTSEFLPDDVVNLFVRGHFNVNAKAESTSGNKTPHKEKRDQMFTLVADKGVDLMHCKSGAELAEALLHALLGWLMYYISGDLHQDISVGNVLFLESAVTRDEFSMEKARMLWKLLNKIPVANAPAAIIERCKEAPTPEPGQSSTVNKFICQIEEAAKRLGISAQCKALLSDGDLSAYLPTYFTQEHSTQAISVSSFLTSKRRQSEVLTFG
ncbi:hypothetical protein SCHPADRAFT_450710 [Schizopora paradoxa]|uniref:Fungal-type protein kinase domain-containing protein n=1 Tax=Schizopora paradoxa TaxID=27342 RepID=A0A0H2S4D3_9AGAM|nr:hypothetical protein SCHPADRAFT_450710 [Schizopora paradoxa]